MTPLVTWLWQGMVLAVATSVVLRLYPRLGAATRHTVWWLAMLAVAILPLGYVAVARSRAATASPPLLIADMAVPVPAAPPWAGIALVLAWGGIVAAGYARIGGSLRAVHRLKRDAIPIDSSRAARLSMWRGVSPDGKPELRISGAHQGACALGLGKPVILVSAALLELEDETLDRVVMHEYAHLARRDDWTQLAQAIVTATCAFHPAICWIGRRIAIEREAACDDLVIARGADAREYARSLTEVAAASTAPNWSSVAAPGAAGVASVLRQRVRRLLDPMAVREGRVAHGVSLACATTLALAIGIAVRAPAFVEFIDTGAVASPAVRRTAASVAQTPLVNDARTRLESAPAVEADRRQADRRAGLPESSVAGNAAQERMPIDLTPLDMISTERRIQAELPPAVPALGGRVVQGVKDPRSPSSWSAVMEPGATAGKLASRAAVATGAGARDAAVSIGRFFGRVGGAVGDSVQRGSH